MPSRNSFQIKKFLPQSPVETLDTASTVSSFLMSIFIVVRALVPDDMFEGVQLDLLAAVLFISIAYMLVRAVWTYRHGKPWPWPSVIWSVVFNRPPIEKSGVLRDARVGLVYQGEGKDWIETLVSQARGYVFVPIDLSDVSEGECAQKLQSLDGLFVFHHGKWRKTEVWGEVLAWARNNSEKPVAAVLLDDEPLPEEIEWVWSRRIMDTESFVGGLSILLSRAVHRAGAWRAQAQRVWVIGLAVFVVLAFAVVSLVQANRYRRRLASIDPYVLQRVVDASGKMQKTISDGLGGLDGEAKKEVANGLRGNIQNFLALIAQQATDPTEDHPQSAHSISVWTRYREMENSRECVCESVPPPAGDVKCFDEGSRAIVACALKQNWIVSWKPKGKIRAWRLGGEELNGAEVSQECRYISDSGFRYGLICLPIGTPPNGVEPAADGICFSSAGGVNVASRELREYLMNLGVSLSTLPLKMLVDDGRFATKCASANSRGVSFSDGATK